MKKALISATFAILAAAATPALPGTKTVTLSVSGMTCPACPITVKKSLTRVEALLKATARAGYPSAVKR